VVATFADWEFEIIQLPRCTRNDLRRFVEGAPDGTGYGCKCGSSWVQWNPESAEWDCPRRIIHAGCASGCERDSSWFQWNPEPAECDCPQPIVHAAEHKRTSSWPRANTQGAIGVSLGRGASYKLADGSKYKTEQTTNPPCNQRFAV